MNKLKVIIAGLFVACLGIGVVSAQDATTAPAKKTTAKKSTTKAKSSTGTTKAADGTAAKPAQHLKKDGTPDKRYKENKTAKPASAGGAAAGAGAPASATKTPPGK